MNKDTCPIAGLRLDIKFDLSDYLSHEGRSDM